jgi:hypothetical protein
MTATMNITYDHIEKALRRIEARLDCLLTPRRTPHWGHSWATLVLMVAVSVMVSV